jgi:hypothetical protein
MNSSRPRQSSLGTGLVHHYVAGVRFDTAVKHAVRTRQGLRLQHVPFPLGFLDEHADPGGGRMSLIRALTILKHIDVGQVDESSVPQPENETAVSIWLQAHWPDVRVDAMRSERPQSIGTAALQAVTTGATCLVRFSAITSTWWSLVVGVESEQRDALMPRSLLLLDTGWSLPWACGHNARIELTATAGSGVGASPGFGLNYRDLGGKALAVRLERLIVLRREERS